MKEELKFKIGDAVIIWHHYGKGIYDGNKVYVRDLNPLYRRYGLSDVNEGPAIGWMPQATLLSVDDFRAMVVSHEIGKLWKGDEDKLVRIYQRYS